MNNSSAITGGITFSAASITPAISWALNGFPSPIPETVPLLLAAALITISHAVYNLAKIKGWFPVEDMETSTTSQVVN